MWVLVVFLGWLFNWMLVPRLGVWLPMRRGMWQLIVRRWSL